LIIEPGFGLHVVSDTLLRADVATTEGLVAGSTRSASSPQRSSTRLEADFQPRQRLDPVTLEILSNAFMDIAERMGNVLARTATSTNIRERLDFSCALFDHRANLVANAPHIPVHLGAMGESVAHLSRAFPAPVAGDVYMSNSPSRGGSHLPDITVVTPVFVDGAQHFFVACRGHHADVGGLTPGSMPPFSRTLAEEGVEFGALHLIKNGHFEREAVLEALATGPYPARHPQQNLADLEAQVAANRTGAKLLTSLCERHGLDVVQRAMSDLQRDAAERVSELCRTLPSHPLRFADHLDDGTPIEVVVTRRDTGLELRFAPTPEVSHNSNAPRAVTVAGVMYVLRCLLGRSLPLNSGCLTPISIHVPERSLLDPSPGRAVCSGNVETSQRVVDVLLGALGAVAASQGTMNNLTFGNADFAYYETIGGGSGAGPNFDGASAVQVHMTNTRITDPEVLERKYPVRLEQFSIRPNSGGDGAHRGGNGVIRQFRFLQEVQVALVTERRNYAPYGLAGGMPGARGLNLLNGLPLPGRHQFVAAAGDVLRIETPGGGGYGAAEVEVPAGAAASSAVLPRRFETN
jgi:5-oxoprolinase (ATP-hydrolysing)